MNSKTRRVAVVGGNRIPFARSDSVYAHASNQDMLTAALDGLTAACPTPRRRRPLPQTGRPLNSTAI
jgi:hypothetical protein